MASRVIREQINASRSLARVSLQADLTFRALIVAADDFGRMEADPLILKAALFPRRPKISGEQARAWVDELAAEGCVQVYVVDGVDYLQLVGWEKHRGKSNRSKQSRFPDPPTGIPGAPGGSGSLPENPASLGVGVGVGVGVGLGVVDDEGSRRKRPKGTAAPRSLTQPERETLEAWCQRGTDKDGLGRPDLVAVLPELVSACFDHHRSKGNRHADWVATCRTWIRNQAAGQFGKAYAGKGLTQAEIDREAEIEAAAEELRRRNAEAQREWEQHQ